MTDLRQAAQQALDKIEKIRTLTRGTLVKLADVEDALRTALEQQAEPVAWMCRRKSEGSLFVYTVEQLHELGYGNISVPSFDKIAPLYTAPPQRQWVGLTDEESTELDMEISGRTMDECVRAIEAKLKAKNDH